MIDFDNMTRRFLLNEGQNTPSISALLESVSRIIKGLRPGSLKEQGQKAVALQQLKEIRRYSRQLQEQVHSLEEKVKLLEEGQ